MISSQQKKKGFSEGTSTVLLTPLVYTVRCYSSPKDVHKLSNFECVLTVTVTTEGQAHISGMHGSFSKRNYKDLKDSLLSLGIEEVSWSRHKDSKIISTIYNKR